jgi:hypothetical protein
MYLTILICLILIVVAVMILKVSRNKNKKISVLKPQIYKRRLPKVPNSNFKRFYPVVAMNNEYSLRIFDETDIQIFEKEKSIVDTPELRSKLNTIIQTAPIIKKFIQSDSKLVLEFSEELTKQFKSHKLSLMKVKDSNDKFRAILVDSGNVARGHGELSMQKMSKLNPAKLANLALGVATVITAQEHLKEINKKLTNILSKVNDLIILISNDSLGKFEGNIQYLKSILPALTENIHNDSLSNYNTIIDNITRETYQQLISTMRRFPDLCKKVNELKLTSNLFIDKEIIEPILSDFKLNSFIVLGNLEVLAICLSLSKYTHTNNLVNEIRLENLKTYLFELIKYETEFIEIINKKIPEYRVRINFNNKNQKIQALVLEQINLLTTDFSSQVNEAEKNINNINNPFPDNKKYMLQINLDKNGEVESINRRKHIS